MASKIRYMIGMKDLVKIGLLDFFFFDFEIKETYNFQS
jgi:hypothetical protein